MTRSAPMPPPDPTALTRQALLLRSRNLYAAHPVESTLGAYRRRFPPTGAEGERGVGFESAEVVYRAGAQGLSLSALPKLPESLAALSRLAECDAAGRRHLRDWAESAGFIWDDEAFEANWVQQGRLGGAEHHVYFDEGKSRWFKRLYFGVNGATLGDYFLRMRLHAVLFPETAYRLEGFALRPRSRELRPVVSQPHVEIDTDRPLVSRAEVAALMAPLGFSPVSLKHDGVVDDGHHAFLDAEAGVLAHDLHDENVVRMRGTGELAVIDPYISLVRRGTWAALKLAEVSLPVPPDDSDSNP